MITKIAQISIKISKGILEAKGSDWDMMELGFIGLF